MSVLLTAEQGALRDSVRRFATERSPLSSLLEHISTSTTYDRALWEYMAGELALPAVGMPESIGGVGGSDVELAVIFEELGRALVCSPFLGTTGLAAPLAMSLEGGRSTELIETLIDGRSTATVALGALGHVRDAAAVTVSAARLDGRWLLSGSVRNVLDGQSADIILVPAQTVAGTSVFAVDPASPGLMVTPATSIDLTRDFAHLELESVSGRLVGPDGGAWEAIATALARTTVFCAAEQLGGARAALDLTVAYAKERIQFGQPIGAFQAIKHRCADVLVSVETAGTAVYLAAGALATGADDVATLASTAKALSSDGFVQAAEEMIQFHGGMGFTWEHPAHLFFRRAKSDEALFGSPNLHRRLVVESLGV